jgi:hypothetical protein
VSCGKYNLSLPSALTCLLWIGDRRFLAS